MAWRRAYSGEQGDDLFPPPPVLTDSSFFLSLLSSSSLSLPLLTALAELELVVAVLGFVPLGDAGLERGLLEVGVSRAALSVAEDEADAADFNFCFESW